MQRPLSQLSFFDCNCILGKRADRQEGEPYSLEELLRDMEYFCIDEALVVHALSKDYDPAIGNNTLCQLIAGHDNLYPVWAILPPSTAELPTPEQFIAQAIERGVKAFTAFPKLHNFSLAEWNIGDLLAQMELARIPLLVPFSETTWSEIESVCAKHPDLPIVIQTVNYRQLRFLLPLWEKHRQLYVDLSWFSICSILPFLAKRNLIDRLLFGTNYPSRTPGAAVTMVTYSEASEEQKQRIAGGNLRQIFKQNEGKRMS